MKRKERLFPVTVYFSPDDYKLVRKIARQTGLSLSDVCRICVLYVVNEVLTIKPFVEVTNRVRRDEQ